MLRLPRDIHMGSNCDARTLGVLQNQQDSENPSDAYDRYMLENGYRYGVKQSFKKDGGLVYSSSAIKGTVIDMHMSLGENVDDNTHHVTVADLSVVWANFSIYQEDLFRVKAGQTASIIGTGSQLKTESRISYISPVVNEKTRTSTARVILTNNEGQWKPGMFVTAGVSTTEKEVTLAIQKSALITYKGQQVVFIKEKNAFRPQPVTIGIQNDKLVEIVSGLFKGQEYISEGAFLIKAELLKDSFGGGHSH